jgi:hypothetical protein
MHEHSKIEAANGAPVLTPMRQADAGVSAGPNSAQVEFTVQPVECRHNR